MKAFHDVFGERLAGALEDRLLSTVGKKPKLQDIREACVAVMEPLLAELQVRPPDKSGIGIRLFFTFDALGVPDEEEDEEAQDEGPTGGSAVRA